MMPYSSMLSVLLVVLLMRASAAFLIIRNTVIFTTPGRSYHRMTSDRDIIGQQQQRDDSTAREEEEENAIVEKYPSQRTTTRQAFLRDGMLSLLLTTTGSSSNLLLFGSPYPALAQDDIAMLPRLGKTSTATEVLQALQQSPGNLASYVRTGGTAVVTGGNTGIGLETVATLARAGMDVVLCSRSVENANDALQQSLPGVLRNRVTILRLDLADMSSIERASRDVIAKTTGGIDLLVNNAGVSDRPQRQETVQGLELQWGVNHLGHFMLTRELLPHIKSAGRIVTVASSAHNYAIPSTDWGSGKYPSAYAQSKLCNILFAKELQDRLLQEKTRSNILSVSLHPGAIRTNIWKDTPLVWRIGETFGIDKDVPQGAATTVFCSLVDENRLSGGGYYSDCTLATPSLIARDSNGRLRKDLWKKSEDVIADKGYSLPPLL